MNPPAFPTDATATLTLQGPALDDTAGANLVDSLLVLPKSSSLADLSTDQLRLALGLRPDELLAGEDD